MDNDAPIWDLLREVRDEQRKTNDVINTIVGRDHCEAYRKEYTVQNVPGAIKDITNDPHVEKVRVELINNSVAISMCHLLNMSMDQLLSMTPTEWDSLTKNITA